MIDPNKQYRTRNGRQVRIYATDGGILYDRDGCPIEAPVHGAVRTEQGWIPCLWKKDGTHQGNKEHSYDLIELDVELQDKIPWPALRPEIEWVAMDESGKWIGFTVRPYIEKSTFTETWNPRHGLDWVIEGLHIPGVDSKDWRQTLTRRPPLNE